MRHTAWAWMFALAGAAGAPAGAMDLAQTWEAARQHDPAFAAARAAHDAGAAVREQAGALWRPTLALQAQAGLGSSDTSTRGAAFTAPGFGTSHGVAFDTSVNNGLAARAGLELRQPLYSRERQAQADELELRAEGAEIDWARAGQALMIKSVEACLATGLAARRVALVERQHEAVRRVLEETRDRFRIGDRPVTEVHEATAREAELRAEELGAANDLQVRQAELADLTGQPARDAGCLLPGPTPPVLPRTLPEWEQRVATDNLDVRAADLELRLARARAGASAGAVSPVVDLVARLGRDHLSGSGNFGSSAVASRDQGVGVEVTVPLWSGGLRQARHVEAAARLEAAAARRDEAALRARQQARSLWLDLSAAARQLDALGAAAEASRSRLEATRTGVQAGDRTTLDLLRAENDLAGAELALLQASTRIVSERLRLDELAGGLDEAALRAANAGLTAQP